MIEASVRHRFEHAKPRSRAATSDDLSADIDVSFVSHARALALFGDSGAGKTTVLNAIAGLLRPDTGRILLDGQVLFDSDQDICVTPSRRRVGYVFQDGRLFPHLNVRANLLYGARGRHVDQDEFDRMVALLDLAALLSRWPASLSGGERQRVAIGRALLSSPRILLLDEPLTGLHQQARVQVLDTLRQMKATFPIAMILVSHHPDEVAALADEVVVLESGKSSLPVSIDQFSRLHPRSTMPGQRQTNEPEAALKRLETFGFRSD